MQSPTVPDFTELLSAWRAGDREAGETILVMVYQELRRLAQYYLQQERADHMLQATALVHEVYLRLFVEPDVEIHDRAHFFQLAGRQMRRILIDHGRALHADKRKGELARAPMEDARSLTWEHPEELLALDECLEQLDQIAPRAVDIVQLRFFCGLTEHEVAELLNISLATLKRDWSFAKGFIYRQLMLGNGQLQGTAKSV